ncbi:MAG: glycoside hydrolase family 43 C-terminal domain-containing protein [Clostridia bacterium]|nr:glycoside hydrolase family 43 C-terminal domain-containing protein [Clostridia bacterium]
MKKALVVVAALMIAMTCALLTACGSEIEGTYKFVSMTYNGETINVGDEVGGYVYDENSFVVTLNKDGTGEYKEGGNTMTGTWKQDSGDVYTLTIDGASLNATIKDGTLTVEDEGRVIVFKK